MIKADLIHLKTYAQNHTFITAMGFEGSLNNPHIPADDWQDIDVTYFTTDVTQFNFNDWCQSFGHPVMVQHNHDDLWGTGHIWNIYLVQFDGYRRIDLKIAPETDIPDYLTCDVLNILVWDRNHDLTPQHPSDRDHLLPMPFDELFSDSLNEFYWCLGNVVKALARQNLIAANEMNNQHVRPELLKNLAWVVGGQHHGTYNPGANYRYLASELPSEVQQSLADSYQQGSLKEALQSVNIEMDLMTWCTPLNIKTFHLSLPDFVPERRAQLMDWISKLQ
ncbi:aminoglycoside 6-adenylyltransferase [Companilactobacillus sp. HBUAS56275]|uniref:Aminoglycoside 6-adenylyltransferase n=1 Tax=Candidatus Companilactobacillus pullicola TaxID=2838523 RepID=A0A9D1ZLA2_9LACO|nr:aminoglycoside 6-adenylyltransferase [Candidatus Companilactobacillus pullicola]